MTPIFQAMYKRHLSIYYMNALGIPGFSPAVCLWLPDLSAAQLLLVSVGKKNKLKTDKKQQVLKVFHSEKEQTYFIAF